MLQYGLSTTPPTLGSLNVASLFGVQIGADVTNNFALSFSGLAVQTPDGRYVTLDEDADSLIDVTPLILPISPYVFRLPATEVHRGDLIITSDPPNFTALYVIDDEDPDELECLDTGTAQVVQYRAPRNLFFQFFVRAVSLFDLTIFGQP